MRFGEVDRQHDAQFCAAPGAMRAGLSQFAAFDPDVIDNRAILAQGRLEMRILALGGEKSLGAMMAEVMRAGATQVASGILPDSGHRILEGNPQATIALVRSFIGR